MSVKIRVSYQHPEELQKVIKALLPMGVTYKIARQQKGEFRKAYIVLKNVSKS